MIAGYTPIDEVIREACQDVGDDFFHYWHTMYRYGIRCFEEMKMDIANRPTIVHLPVDQDTKTVALPTNFVNYITVGVEQRGIIWALGYNPQMCRPSKTDCGEDVLGEGGLPNGLTRQIGLRNEDGSLQGWGEGYWNYDWNTYDGERYGGQKVYGLGGGWNQRGYYKVMHEDGIILLNPEFNWTEIVLVYVSRAYEPGSITYIPDMLKECIINYCKWKWFEFKTNTSGKQEMRDFNNKAMIHREQYYVKLRLSAGRMRNNSAYEIVAAYRRAYGNIRM